MVTASLTPTLTSSLSLAGVTILIVLRVSNRIEASSLCDNEEKPMFSSKHALYNSPQKEKLVIANLEQGEAIT